MADIIRNIVTRIDSTVNWTTLNPVPANGEQCIEILPKGLFKLKVGDGKTPWIALKYATMNGYDPRIGDLDELITRDKSTIVYAINSVQEEVNLTEDDIARIKEVLKHVVPQYSVLPTASALTLGVVAQYIGETTEDYTHNCFYEVVSKTEVDPETGETVTVYKWEKTDTTDLSKKVDKTEESNKIYGTNDDGEQVIYDKEDFGKVDDVQLNGTSVVVDKIANIEPNADDVDYTTETFTEVTTVKEALDTIIGDEITFGYTTSTAVGGLPKDTDINNWTLAQVMKQILSPTAVTEPTLSLGNIASTSGVAGSTHKFTKGTIVAVISWTAGTSTNPSNYILTGINADRFEIDGTNIKLKADETFVAGTTGALTFGVSRTYKIVNSLGKTETKTASATNGSLAYSATYPSYVGTTEEIATDFITSITSAIGLKPILGRYAETKNSAYTTYTVPNKEMLTYTNRLVIINKGIYTKIKDASGDITGNFKITSKSLSLYGTATATYTIAVLVNPSAGYKDTLTIS